MRYPQLQGQIDLEAQPPASEPPGARVCDTCRRKRSKRRPAPTLSTHQWQRTPRTAVGAELADLWRCVRSELASDDVIRGGVRSYDCFQQRFAYILTHACEDRLRLSRHARHRPLEPLLRVSASYFRWLMARHIPSVFGPQALQRRPYYLNAMKLLWSAPGEGLQTLHYDIARRNLARKRFVALLYCTPSHHTAMPNAPAEDLQAGFNTGNRTSEAQYQRNLALFSSVPFVSELVPAGSAMVFNASVAHYGVENTSRRNERIVLFAMFGPKPEKGADDTQRFPLGER